MPQTRGGSIWSFSAQPGVGTQGALTQMGDITGDWAGGEPAIATTGIANVANVGPQPNLAYWLLGFVVVLVLLKIISEHAKAEMDTKHVAVNVWNFGLITLYAILGLAGAKVIVNKYPKFKAITQIVNAA